MLYKEWYEAQLRKIGLANKAKRAAQQRVAKYQHPVTERQAKYLKALGEGVTFGVGSPDKRFVRQMSAAQTLSYGQAVYLARLVYRYRRQLRLSDDAAKQLRDALSQDAEAIKQAAEQQSKQP